MHLLFYCSLFDIGRTLTVRVQQQQETSTTTTIIEENTTHPTCVVSKNRHVNGCILVQLFLCLLLFWASSLTFIHFDLCHFHSSSTGLIIFSICSLFLSPSMPIPVMLYSHLAPMLFATLTLTLTPRTAHHD